MVLFNMFFQPYVPYKLIGKSMVWLDSGLFFIFGKNIS